MEEGEIPSLPTFAFPVDIFECLQLQWKNSVVAFPRIEPWMLRALSVRGRVLPTEALLFRLMQELMLTDNQCIGNFIVEIAKAMPNYVIDYEMWLQFVVEYAYSFPHYLVFILSIVRPKLFRQEKSDQFPISDLCSILVSSLFCCEVYKSPKSWKVVNALKSLLLDRELACTAAMNCALDNASITDLIAFENIFPVIPSTSVFVSEMCSRVISVLFGNPVNNELAFSMTVPMQELASRTDEQDVTRFECVLSMLLKWIVVKIRLGAMNGETLSRIREQIDFEVQRPFGESMFVKERLHLARAQISRFIEFVTHQEVTSRSNATNEV